MGVDYTAWGTSVPACFERAARLYPTRVAICCRLGEINYSDLNGAANRLAHLIKSRGSVGDRVAILMPQDRRIFLTMLAALKAGRIVVVLNGEDPPARIRQLLDDAEPAVILTVDSHQERARESARPNIDVINVDLLLED